MSRSEAQPVQSTSKQFAQQLNTELLTTRDFLIRTDSRREKHPVAHRFGFPVEYDPEDARPVTLQPICQQKRWWPISDAEPYGLTEDAVLTMTDTNGIINPVMIAQVELPPTLVHRLRVMRRL